MKQIRTKVLMSAIVLAFAIIATIGTTFAWFTISTTVQVGGMEMYVASQDNLLIRIYNGENITDDLESLSNPSTYQTFMALADIQVGYPNLNTYKMSPVTAVNDDKNAIDPQNLLLFNIDNKTTTPTGLANVNAANGNFIELKFWVLYQGTLNQTLGMQAIGVQANNGSPSVKDAVANAVFVAAWINGTEDWEVYNKDKADYAIEFTLGQRGYDSVESSNNLIPALNRIALINLHTDYVDSNLTTMVNLIPQLLTIRFYIEGWDLETTNNIIASQFTISFILELKP